MTMTKQEIHRQRNAEQVMLLRRELNRRQAVSRRYYIARNTNGTYHVLTASRYGLRTLCGHGNVHFDDNSRTASYADVTDSEHMCGRCRLAVKRNKVEVR